MPSSIRHTPAFTLTILPDLHPVFPPASTFSELPQPSLPNSVAALVAPVAMFSLAVLAMMAVSDLALVAAFDRLAVFLAATLFWT